MACSAVSRCQVCYKHVAQPDAVKRPSFFSTARLPTPVGAALLPFVALRLRAHVHRCLRRTCGRSHQSGSPRSSCRTPSEDSMCAACPELSPGQFLPVLLAPILSSASSSGHVACISRREQRFKVVLRRQKRLASSRHCLCVFDQFSAPLVSQDQAPCAALRLPAFPSYIQRFQSSAALAAVGACLSAHTISWFVGYFNRFVISSP